MKVTLPDFGAYTFQNGWFKVQIKGSCFFPHLIEGIVCSVLRPAACTFADSSVVLTAVSHWADLIQCFFKWIRARESNFISSFHPNPTNNPQMWKATLVIPFYFTIFNASPKGSSLDPGLESTGCPWVHSALICTWLTLVKPMRLGLVLSTLKPVCRNIRTLLHLPDVS